MSTQLIEYDATPTAVAVRAQEYLAIARAFVIDDDDTYEAAAEELGTIKQIEKALDEERKTRGEPLRLAVNAINDAYRAPLDFCADAKVAFEDKIRAFREQKRREAAEAQRKAEEAARAEAARLAREAAEREAAARAESEAKAKAAAEELAKGNAEAAAALAHQAAQATEQGQAEAQALVAQAAMTIVVPAQTVVPKVAGLSGTIKWKARVTDRVKAIMALASNPALHHLLTIDEAELNRLADRQRETFNVPGCETYQTEELRNRRRA